MKSLSFSRESARLTTTVSQGAALLLAAGAVAAIVIPGGGEVSRPSPVQPQIDGQMRGEEGVSQPVGFRDFGSIADLLQAYDKPVVAPPPTTPNQATRATQAEPPLRYLGSIDMPGRRSAIMALEGEQRILKPGGQIRDYVVERITDDYVEVSRGGRITRVSRIRPGDVQISMLGGQPVGINASASRELDPRTGRPLDPSMGNMTEDTMADGTTTRADPSMGMTTSLGAQRMTPAQIKAREEMAAKMREESEGININKSDGDDAAGKQNPDSAGASDS